MKYTIMNFQISHLERVERSIEPGVVIDSASVMHEVIFNLDADGHWSIDEGK